MKITTGKWNLLPPAEDVCRICAVKHEPDEPHNRDSLYYQIKFHKDYQRWPTWGDALAHCPEEVQAIWKSELQEKGIKIGEFEDRKRLGGLPPGEKENPAS